MGALIERTAKTCDLCVSSDKSAKTGSPAVPFPEAPWDKLGIDFAGPMQGTERQRYAIVLVDYYSSG